MNYDTDTPRVSAIEPMQSGTIFDQQSTLPFGAVDFAKITPTDFLPAFRAAMAQHRAEIDAIANNPDPPTFENTILAYEEAGRAMSRVGFAFSVYTGTISNDTIDAINAELSPERSAHYSAIRLNQDLFARIKAIYDNRAAMTMEPQDAALLEDIYSDMVHAGALLSESERERVSAIDSELSEITTLFGKTLRQAGLDNALVVETREELAGLSEGEIAAAAKLAEERGMAGKYVLALQNTTQQPILPALENRQTRERLFKASVSRGAEGDANDTRMLLARIATLRAQKAELFGKSSWAEYTMHDRMLSKPEEALAFMQGMVPALAATQRREAAMINDAIAAVGGNHTVEPWDWYRYANAIKKERYSIDEDKLAEYFVLDRVLEDGVFFAMNKLYGVSFEQRSDLPVWHPDVTSYTVFDADGSELGLFYFDPFQRPSKRGGAWKSSFVKQSNYFGTKPVLYNVLNIPKAQPGEVQLVSFDNVNTMFHEMGHAIHGLLSDVKYASISGTSTARDFVEFPSQVHEMPATDPAILANYAKHYKTGETLPMEMIERLEEAAQFNQGYDFGEVVAAALLDMKWHALSHDEAKALDSPEKVDAFEAKALAELGLETELVPPRYHSSYFNHIFSSPAGYSAGYYSYLWTEVLDRDTRKWLANNGGLTRENGEKLREIVMSKGGTRDYAQMVRDLLGRDPDVTPMLGARGLIDDYQTSEAVIETSDGQLTTTGVGQ